MASTASAADSADPDINAAATTQPAAPLTEKLATISVDADSGSADAPAKAAQSRLAIDEVIVTAQKREENLQDVPISVQAFTGEMLDAKGVTDPTALPSITPGMTYGAITGFTIIFMRGIGSDVFLPNGDASVATYIDNVYFPLNAGLAQSFGSIERIEVLKGPQGTLFGRNTTGGAINILSKDPTDHWGGTLGIGYASFSDFKSTGEIGGPLTDTLSVSLGLLYNHAENWYENSGPKVEGKLAPIEEKGARLKFRWRPLDELDIKLTGYTLSSSGSKFNMTVDEVKPAGQAALVMPPPDPYKDHTDSPQFSTTDVNVGMLDAKWDFDAATLRSISSYQDTSYFTLTDFDGSNMPVAIFDGTAVLSGYTQELQLLSNQVPSWLQWIVGAYYLKTQASFNPQLTALSNNTLFRNLGPVGDLVNQALPQATLQLYGAIDTEATALFGQATAEITDAVALTVGGRYQRETRKVYNSSSVLEQDNTFLAPVLISPPDSRDTSNFSPKVTLDYKAFEDALFYATWAKGFKSGTFNMVNIITRPSYVSPEEVTSYELGMKADFFDKNLRLNVAAFRNELKNSQQMFISLLSGGIVHLENAGALRINGAEIDLTWQIVDGLIFGLGAAYLDGVYQDFSNTKGYDPVLKTFRANLDVTGNETVRTPEYSGNASLSYTFAALGGVWEASADYYANAGYFFDYQNIAEQPQYKTVGARLSYLYEAWNLRVTAFGQNLSDEIYFYNKYQDDFGTLQTVAPPRTVGVRLNWEF